MSLALNDTICAIATPPGQGGIGIVRVSGEKAIEVASCMIRLRSGQHLKDVRPRKLCHVHLIEAAAVTDASGSARSIDDALVVVMPSPRSYTGEDVVEIHCHGGPFILERVCEQLIGLGARLAQPGEFTRRAFLNGKLDLAQAEAVLDTIRAKTATGLRMAQEQLQGALSEEIDGLRDRLIGLLAHLEAAIDFTEEDIAFVSEDSLTHQLEQAVADLLRLADSATEGRIFREGLTAAIIGRPNVGKSSLLNALLRTDRAIVTAIPGTTRDVLEEAVNIRGIPVRLLDTAGVRETADPVEHEGIARSLKTLGEADLVLLVLDGSVPLTEEDRDLMRRCEDLTLVLAVNKIDLGSDLSADAFDDARRHRGQARTVRISAKTGAGLDDLRDTIRSLFVRPDFEPNEAAVITTLRHRTCVLNATEALRRSLQSVQENLSNEFIAMDLRGAIDALGEITGAVTTDDILERIFSEFCIGK
jgi:tRNA modification GTPase